MRLFGMTLFVLAIVLFVGSIPVDAQAANVTLCKENKVPCAETQRYAAGTELKAALAEGTQSELLTNLGTVKCKESSLKAKTTAEAGEPLAGEITALSIASCTLGETKCTTSVEHPPYATTLESPGLGSGTLILGEGKGGKPSFLVECGGAFTCKFLPPKLAVKGGGPAKLTSSYEVGREKPPGGLCPATSTWNVEYTISEPSPLFVSTT